MMEPHLEFTPLSAAHLPQLNAWLNEPHVLRWYSKKSQTYEETESYYGAKVSDSRIRCYVFSIEGIAAGYIQWYRIDAYPDYCRFVQPEGVAAGIDLFIGNPEYFHRGHGSHVIESLLESYVFADPAITCCLLGPDPANADAIRAYEKAGFRYWKTITMDTGAEEYLMRRDKA